MVRWHLWQRVTGRWVTVTGKRRELDLLIISYSASPAAVATPCPVLAAPFTACRYRTAPSRGVRCGGIADGAPGTTSARPVVPAQDRPETVPPASRFPGAASLGERTERLKAAPGTFHHAPMMAKPHAVADCPAAGEQGPDGRQVNPAAGGSAGTEGRRTCPPAPLVPLTGGQGFLARPRAKPRDSDSAPRGPLMDLSRTCRRPAVDLTPRRRAGCAGQISLSPARPRGEGHSQMEGFQIEGGPTPYPHIALCATALKSIYSRRIGRMCCDVPKRCLPPRAAAGPE
jgi:hypothetical protein